MPRGGKRAGAGRPKGGSNRREVTIAKILNKGIAPLDVYESVIPELLASKDPLIQIKALEITAKFAPFFHSKFAASESPARPHKTQERLPLFDGPPPPPPAPIGKKGAADQAAANAALGTGWGDLLDTDKVN